MGSPSFQERRKHLLAFIQRIHGGQMRAGGNVPMWHHPDRVSRVLEMILTETGEGDREEREEIILAALGHDAIEDTDVTREELEEAFGARGLALIDGMTNTFGDDHPEPYVEQIIRADEGVRLIKLSDLYDNCTNVAFALFGIGLPWAEGHFLPIVRPMVPAILRTPFEEYPRAADRLKGMVAVAYGTLLEEIERYRLDSQQES